MSEADNFKNRYLQQPITFLTEENLDKLENHCKKAIHYERGVEHQVVLELLERYKEFLAEREEDKKKINKLEYCVEELKKYNKTISDRVVEYKKNRIPKQKVINSINYYDERIKHAKLIKDKEQEELYIYIKRAFYKLLEDK